jgi:hypothetical protein
VTVDVDLKQRLFATAERIPGATVSGILRELLKVGLPIFEQVAEVMTETTREDGTLDRELAQERMGQWIGVQMLKMYDTRPRSEGEVAPDR